jgi:hypothetical protein
MDVKHMDNSNSRINKNLSWQLIIIVLGLFLSACQEKITSKTDADKNESVNIKSHIGWLHNNCLAIKNTGLNTGEKINIIAFEMEQQLYTGTITNKTDTETSCPQLLEDRKAINIAEGYSFYTIKSDAKKLDIGIGLVGINAALQKINNNIAGDINGDTIQDYFTQCSSSEGIHFNIWSNKPYKGKAIWTGYYYLGYDLEPNCPQLQ